MNLDEIQQIFFQECEEGLATMEASFASVRQGGHDTETINTIFRSVHSIKGGAGAFGHERLQAFTHEYETLLDLVRNGTLDLTSDLLGTIVGAFDMLSDHVAAARDGGDAPADGPMLARLVAASTPGAVVEAAPEPVAAAPAAAPIDDFDDLFEMCESVPEPEESLGNPGDWTVTFVPGTNALDNGGDPLLLVRELTLLEGEVLAADVSRLPLLSELHPERSYLGWTAIVPGSVAEDDIRGIFEFIGDCELTVTRIGEAAVSDDDLIADMLADVMPAAPASAPVEEILPVAAPVPAAAPTPAPVAAAPNPPPAPIAAPAPATPAPAATVLPAEPAAPRPAAAPPAQTIRVDLDKLDRLVNLVGELVIAAPVRTWRRRHQRTDRPRSPDARVAGIDDGDPRAADEDRLQPRATHHPRAGGRNRQARPPRHRR